MRRLFVRLSVCFALLASAAPNRALAAPADREKRAEKEAELKKKDNVAIDKSLAGDITRQKEEVGGAIPLQYDQFRIGVQLQVHEKRLEQIQSLKKIISFGSGDNPKEAPSLLFRLGELYWEESKYYFFEQNRKDDDLIEALNKKDVAAQESAKKGKIALKARQDEFAKLAVEQYSEIVQRYKDYERTDEVLYLLGHNLMEMGDDHKALVAYKRLVDKFPKSKFLPDAYLAFGEYYFNNAKGKGEMLTKALENYKKAASFPENQVYGFALYKQGWCYFNLADFPRAMDMWKTVILYGEFAGEKAVEQNSNTKGKSTLVKEARSDYVRAYSRWMDGGPLNARDNFGKVASKSEDRFQMMKQLANLYYDDGKDREAALMYDMLIKEKPLSPEAPGFQGKIVDCVLRAGNKRMTVNQVRRLVKIMQDVERSGVIDPKNEKDVKALAKAKDLAERTMSNLAVNWHNEARKSRDEETFGFANEVYADYLALFPDNAKAYDLRFFWAELLNDNLQKYELAAEQYKLVTLMDVKRIEGVKNADGTWKVKPGAPGKWLTNAAYDAVLAYDEVVKKAEEKGEIKPIPKSDDPRSRVEMPPQKKALLAACERYLKYLPKGEKRVEISFKVARLYYSYRYYDEAIKGFSNIALNSPDYKFENGDRAGEIAANLVLDSYNAVKDYAKLNEWARRFYLSEKLAQGPFRIELARVIEESSFKLVEQLEKKNEYAKAAEEYLKFVKDFPHTDKADQAIWNASVDFFKAHMGDRSIETREHLIRTYPKSKFVPLAIFNNAEAHEAIGEFELAADSYEAYVRGYEKSLSPGQAEKLNRRKGKHTGKPSHTPAKGALAKSDEKGKEPSGVQEWKEPDAQNALLNAGIYRDGLGQHKVALKDREKFLELWPSAKDADAVSLSIVELYERMGQYGQAVKKLEDYESDNQRDPERVLTAEGRIMAIYRDKMKQPRRVFGMNKRVLTYYDKLYARQRKALNSPALDPVARATFAKHEDDFAHYMRLKLHWGRGPDPKEFKKNLSEKVKSQQEVERLYTEVVKLKAADPAICALYRIGTSYENLAENLDTVQFPKSFPQETQDALRDQFAQQSEPMKTKAGDAFSAAVAKARELSLYNDCSQKALVALREKYRPDAYPPMFEETADLKTASLKARAVGADVVGSIQPAVAGVNLLNPPAATLALPTKKAAAEEKPPVENERPSVGKEDDLSDLGRGMKPASTPSTASEPRPEPTRTETPKPASKAGSDEPEDNL